MQTNLQIVLFKSFERKGTWNKYYINKCDYFYEKGIYNVKEKRRQEYFHIISKSNTCILINPAVIIQIRFKALTLVEFSL